MTKDDNINRLFYMENGALYPELASDYYKRIITKERAEFIRKIVIEHGSQDPEKIGQLCSDKWGGDWGLVADTPNLNRCFWIGTGLISNAAKFFGEDVTGEPWNIKMLLNDGSYLHNP